MPKTKKHGMSKKIIHKPVNLKTLSLVEAKMLDNSCERKKQYSNKNIARLKATNARKKTGELIEAYKCTYVSSHWHIGHSRRVTQ